MEYWNCSICDKQMQMQSREQHLAGKRHAAAAEAYQGIISQERRPQGGSKSWTCRTCNIEIQTQSRDSHLSGYRHAEASRSQQEESYHEVYSSDHNNATTNSLAQATILPASSGIAGITGETIFATSDVTEVNGAPGVLVWQCTLCSCCVPLSVKQLHLSSHDHIQKLLEMIKITCMTIPEPQVQASDNDLGAKERLGYQDVVYETKRLAGRIRDQNSHQEATAKPSATTFAKLTTQSSMKSKPAPHIPSTGPLDAFFLSFRGYRYDPSVPPAESFRSFRGGLRRWNDWDGTSPETWKKYEEDVYARYQSALTKEFNLWFGTEDSIDCWHALCRAIGIRPLPTTCDECRAAVRGKHVNIVDLIEWAREREVGQVDIFDSVRDLSNYSYDADKIYQRDQCGQGAVLRHLLRKLAKERTT